MISFKVMPEIKTKEHSRISYLLISEFPYFSYRLQQLPCYFINDIYVTIQHYQTSIYFKNSV